MVNLAARFRETIDQLVVCPDPILRAEAQELKGLIDAYDRHDIDEATLETQIQVLHDRLEVSMVKTTCYNILNTPIEIEEYVHVPPQINTEHVTFPGEGV